MADEDIKLVKTTFETLQWFENLWRRLIEVKKI